MKNLNKTIKSTVANLMIAATVLTVSGFAQTVEAGPRALLPLGHMQAGMGGFGHGYYSPGAPYFNKERVPKGSTIEEYQKGRENDVGKNFDDWNTSLAGPEAHEPGYKSGYEANGGNKLGKMLEQARGSIQEDGTIKMVPPKKAETFDISENVQLNSAKLPEIQHFKQIGEKVKEHKQKNKSQKRSDASIIRSMNK